MPPELNIYGLYVPGFFGLMLAAYITSLVVRHVASQTGFYALVWHRAAFDLAVYAIILGIFFSLTRMLVAP
ncbi:DUF1656 domain-containing protein [Bradyrhizobium sp. INPA01-394B]|jgi:hypothetical protein|uniref:DUF1656 domain-containing protein n=1 Tax=Bradyrhizobium campsiandrae TaxID=1729892 RepID=A0ABR7U4Q2_9BRAD|nr:DUF1656 domain-containing protein [Bradyrhizobium campsiandrae]MBC9881416.1 DUF1656 domain-containing protein [Bradyrhizobium campsiandrae]MBC9979043.1 DUF1656 domain-containing protein [Bradyrhizobium campsiandrae]